MENRYMIVLIVRHAICNWYEKWSGMLLSSRNIDRLPMISAYQSALSGLQAFSTKVTANGNNIANISTEGFKGSRVLLEQAVSGSVSTNVEQLATPPHSVYETTTNGYELVELSNVDLAEEIPDMTLNEIYYKANLRTIQATNEMFGSLLSLKA